MICADIPTYRFVDGWMWMWITCTFGGPKYKNVMVQTGNVLSILVVTSKKSISVLT